MFGRSIAGITGPCETEEGAFDACQMNLPDPDNRVTGSRATCRYRVPSGGSAMCEVTCSVGDNSFWSECSGPAGLPLECVCRVNMHYLQDFYAERFQFYVSDCRDAAQTMADGECVNRLDCCFTYPRSDMIEGCGCTSDPSALGLPSCEAMAAEGGGQVIPICPQYTADFDGWPPQ